MKLKTTTVAVPATTKTVVDQVQKFSSSRCGVSMEVHIRVGNAGGKRYADVATGRIDTAVAQGGHATDFRELAEFMTAIAVELEARQ